jgi:hypothetical protein
MGIHHEKVEGRTRYYWEAELMHKPMKFFTDHEILMSGYVCCRSSTSEVIIEKKSFVSMNLYIQMQDVAHCLSRL